MDLNVKQIAIKIIVNSSCDHTFRAHNQGVFEKNIRQK